METFSPEKSIITFGAWLETPPGNYVRNWEHTCLDELTVDTFGFNATQMGLPQIQALRASRMPHIWLTDNQVPANTNDDGPKVMVVVQEFENLPFASNSIDLVVLPHVLEFSKEPHQVLREVERVLIPEGKVIITGFNPFSLWGGKQLVGRLNEHYFLPQDGEFISLPRLKDWLKLLDMEVGSSSFGCYAPPCETAKWLERSAFMEQLGERWWPFFGAVYAVQAVKRVKGMRLIGPPWKIRQAAAPQVVPVTNKAKH